jgi:hypothetical protein
MYRIVETDNEALSSSYLPASPERFINLPDMSKKSADRICSTINAHLSNYGRRYKVERAGYKLEQ